ncbi:hypothetical protein SGFS_098460 [Streptomyces graminofaciens]|uniref:Uncharacterized protein n=1 Tax=Streptomyces graminofaciens TaxID=68212 RepID=A0ABN5W4J4_9ACTN|nr:hypothetical protein SGFS_098460 [Streptomyces graminofaciens]
MARRASYLPVTYGVWHRTCKRGSGGRSVGADECRRIDALNLGVLGPHDLCLSDNGTCPGPQRAQGRPSRGAAR